MLLADLPPNLPVLFLATAKVPQAELEEQVASIFGSSMYVPFSFPFEDQFDVFCFMVKHLFIYILGNLVMHVIPLY